jgi:hypothetical protein
MISGTLHVFLGGGGAVLGFELRTVQECLYRCDSTTIRTPRREPATVQKKDTTDILMGLLICFCLCIPLQGGRKPPPYSCGSVTPSMCTPWAPRQKLCWITEWLWQSKGACVLLLTCPVVPTTIPPLKGYFEKNLEGDTHAQEINASQRPV